MSYFSGGLPCLFSDTVLTAAVSIASEVAGPDSSFPFPVFMERLCYYEPAVCPELLQIPGCGSADADLFSGSIRFILGLCNALFPWLAFFLTMLSNKYKCSSNTNKTLELQTIIREKTLPKKSITNQEMEFMKRTRDNCSHMDVQHDAYLSSLRHKWKWWKLNGSDLVDGKHRAEIARLNQWSNKAALTFPLTRRRSTKHGSFGMLIPLVHPRYFGDEVMNYREKFLHWQQKRFRLSLWNW